MGAQDLISKAVIQTDRHGWARRGHVEFDGNQVLAVEVNKNDLVEAATKMDDWVLAYDGTLSEIQHVYRRGKRILYGRVVKS